MNSPGFWKTPHRLSAFKAADPPSAPEGAIEAVRRQVQSRPGGDRRPLDEEAHQEPDRVGDIDGTVVVRVEDILAADLPAVGLEEEMVEEADGIGDIEIPIIVRVPSCSASR
jgi:hypothetical protein